MRLLKNLRVRLAKNPIRSSFLPEVPAFSQASANPTLQPLPFHPTAEARLGNFRWIVAQLRLRGVPSRIHPKQRDQGPENKDQRQECACIHTFSPVPAIVPQEKFDPPELGTVSGFKYRLIQTIRYA